MQNKSLKIVSNDTRESVKSSNLYKWMYICLGFCNEHIYLYTFRYSNTNAPTQHYLHYAVARMLAEIDKRHLADHNQLTQPIERKNLRGFTVQPTQKLQRLFAQ